MKEVKKEKRIELRLDKDLYDFIKADADKFEMKVSSYVRMLLIMSRNLVESEKKRNANN